MRLTKSTSDSVLPTFGCCSMKRWVSSRHDSMAIIEKLTSSLGLTLDLSHSTQVLNVEPEEARRLNLANGMPPYTADALFELFAERRKGKESRVSAVIPEVFGWQPTRFAEFAARNAAQSSATRMICG